MKKTIKIINSISGEVVFEYKTENNTIRHTMEEAVKRGVDFSDAKLILAKLVDADLHHADLHHANLYGAILYGANLYGANLYGANLRGANLRGANLRGANLRGADLDGANLYGAKLVDADLHHADLHHADLFGADLRGADLRGADLRGANLYGADLYGANLYGAKLVDADLYGAYIKDDITLLAGDSIFRISDIGSRMGTTYAYNTNRGIYIQCGCFFGTIKEFANRVEQTHGGNYHGKVYKALIEIIKLRFADDKIKNVKL